MKQCSQCKESKPKEDFYREARAPDGLYAACKKCHNTKQERHRKETNYYADYYARSNFKASRKSGGFNTYAYRKEILKRYADRNKGHIAARQAVTAALKKGRLSKLPCKECGSIEVQAHHHAGYAKENVLNVVWLCQTHHTLAHKKT